MALPHPVLPQVEITPVGGGTVNVEEAAYESYEYSWGGLANCDVKFTFIPNSGYEPFEIRWYDPYNGRNVSYSILNKTSVQYYYWSCLDSSKDGGEFKETYRITNVVVEFRRVPEPEHTHLILRDGIGNILRSSSSGVILRDD